MYVYSRTIIYNITIGGVDYVNGPYIVKISPNLTKVSFNVNIVGDTLLESNETFLLTIISNELPNHVIINNPSGVTVTIVDDDCKLFYV